MPSHPGAALRRVFRLKLPSEDMLKAVINDQVYLVQEVAEYSLWLTVPDIVGCRDAVSGTVIWNNGEESQFQGEVGRINKGARVIWNVTGIGMQDVVREQRRLLAKYPVRQDGPHHSVSSGGGIGRFRSEKETDRSLTSR